MPSIADKNVGIIRKHIEYNLNTLNNNSLNDVRKFPQVNPNEVKKLQIKITYLKLMKCNIRLSLGKMEKIPHNIINIRHSNK